MSQAKEDLEFFQQLVGNQLGIFPWSFDLQDNTFLLPPDSAILFLGRKKNPLHYDDFYTALLPESLRLFSTAMEKAINLEEEFVMDLFFEHDPRTAVQFSCFTHTNSEGHIVLRGLLKKKEEQAAWPPKDENMELWLNSGLSKFQVVDDEGATVAEFGRKPSPSTRGIEWKEGQRISTVYDFRNKPRYQIVAELGEPVIHRQAEKDPVQKQEKAVEEIPLEGLLHFSTDEEKYVAITHWLGKHLQAQVAALGIFDGNRFVWKAWWKSPVGYTMYPNAFAGEWLPNPDWLIDLEINHQISPLRNWWSQEDLPFEIPTEYGVGWMIMSENTAPRTTAILAVKTFDPQSVRDKTAQVLKGLGLLKKSDKNPEKPGQTLQEEIRQRDLLIKEINHRAKNNLALAASLVKMEAGFSNDADARKILKNTQKRLETLASLHELMYRDPAVQDSVDMQTYLTPLVNGLVSSFGNSNLLLELHVDSVRLEVKKANTIGLLVNELISNAFKHAFAVQEEGILKVDFLDKSDYIKLRVSDNGPGFDPASAAEDSLGNILIEEFSRQLDAKMEIDGMVGTTYLIEFKK